jgi:hypothetical protein
LIELLNKQWPPRLLERQTTVSRLNDVPDRD